MILEAQIEQKLLGQLSSMTELSGYQFLTSRETVASGNVIQEDDDKDGVIAIATGFRENDAFSLPTIVVPVELQVLTRQECDPTGQVHESAMEKIADKLSYWHKYPTSMSTALTTGKFSAGELYMAGGSGRVSDKPNRVWSERIDFRMKGSEIFTA